MCHICISIPMFLSMVEVPKIVYVYQTCIGYTGMRHYGIFLTKDVESQNFKNGTFTFIYFQYSINFNSNRFFESRLLFDQ